MRAGGGASALGACVMSPAKKRRASGEAHRMIEVYACLTGIAERPAGALLPQLPAETPVRVAFFFWVVKTADGGVALIDTGLSEAVAARRGFAAECWSPQAVLGEVGIAPGDVRTILVSHLHFDHFADPQLYPNASFVVQSADLDFFRRENRPQSEIRAADAQSLAELDAIAAGGRLAEIAGDVRVAAGLRAVLVGGHTPGSQVFVVDRGSEPLVFACDAAHYYANLADRVPANYGDRGEGLAAFETIERLSAGGRWFPGHDPQVVERLEPVTQNVLRVR